MARFAQFANIPHHNTLLGITSTSGQVISNRCVNHAPGPLSAVLHWVGVYPHPIHDLQLHHQNAELALDPSTKPGRGGCQTNPPKKSAKGQSGVNLCGCFTGQLNPQIQVAPSLLRPAKAQACCTHLPTWPGSVRANARPLRRDAWLLQGSRLDHKEVLELLEEGEGCIDLDMAGKIRSNLRVLGDMSIVMLNARGYQFFLSSLWGKR